MLGTVFPLCWCIGLACSNPGAFKLLGRARSWWEHGSLQEVSCQWVLPRTTATTVSVPTESQSHTLTSPGAPLRPACRSHPVSYEVSAFSLRCSAYETLCVPSKRGKLLLPSVLWSSYDQALLAFKVNTLEVHPFNASPPECGAEMGLRTLTPVEELLWYIWSL